MVGFEMATDDDALSARAERSESEILLGQAMDEIRSLRQRNEKMAMRLSGFDDALKLLGAEIHRDRMGMAEDLVWKIERHLQECKNGNGPRPSEEAKARYGTTSRSDSDS